MLRQRSNIQSGAALEQHRPRESTLPYSTPKFQYQLKHKVVCPAAPGLASNAAHRTPNRTSKEVQRKEGRSEILQLQHQGEHFASKYSVCVCPAAPGLASQAAHHIQYSEAPRRNIGNVYTEADRGSGHPPKTDGSDTT